MSSPQRPEQRSRTVLVYASDAGVRDSVRTALGRRPADDVGRLEYVEAADRKQVVRVLDAGGIDLVVLDGEAWPTGGMGVARQIKYEYAEPPPCLVLVARRDDRWLATWSLADAVLQHPADPVALRDLAAGLLRRGVALPGRGTPEHLPARVGVPAPGSDGPPAAER